MFHVPKTQFQRRPIWSAKKNFLKYQEKICADLLADATRSYLRCSAMIVENVGIQRLVPFRVLAVQHHHSLCSSIPGDGDRRLKVGGGGDGSDGDGGGGGDGDGNGKDFADDC